ncbi:MAG: hypothetical protein ACXWNJ_05395 [Vulcanimicrobiaceae bacterium]
MRTLTEVFAPGAPTLPEGLRTLVVSPERELEPGMTVRATFTFRNQGGAPATGVRVRFNVPEGLVYLVGTGTLDGRELDDEQGNSPLLARSGAHIGDVAPGEERRIEMSYSVAGAIENGSTVEIQAAVAAFEIAPVGSNIVRLIARSKPALENAQTGVAFEGRHAAASAQDAKPGGEVVIAVRVHNAGESSAHDVVVVSPVPEHTTYVANSARVNGRELERDLGTSFDRAHAPIIIKNLPANATATLTYRVRVDEPLANGTPIVAQAQVASQEMPAFALEPATLHVTAAPDFDDDQTSFAVDPAYDVPAGGRVTIRLRATNSGTTAAENVGVTIGLPEGLIPVRGAARIDGRPLRERKKETLHYDLGRIDARASCELIAEAVVASPIANGTQLPVTARLAWPESERRFERSVVVRSEPFLMPRRNAIERIGGAVVRPDHECEAVVTIANDGSAPVTDAVLQLRIDSALDDVRVSDKNGKLTVDPATGSAQPADSVEIGTIEPYSARRLTIRAHVRSPYPDRTEIRLGASLHAHELGEMQLGEAHWRVDSHPAFSPEQSTLGLISDDVFRPNQLADVFVKLPNEGTDVAHNVRLRLYVSPEARLENVDGATREKSTLLFGDIPPGALAEARLGLRLLRSLAREFPVTLEGVLTADAMLPVQLHRLTIVTTAEPDFAVGAFRSDPGDVADVGETIEYVLHVRNGGDGPARRVQIHIDQLESLIYVPNSTTVNDVPVRDVGAQPPFASERGIVLNDVDPGVEATIRWHDVVHNGLAAGEAITRTARIRYDGERVDEIASTEIKVRSAPAFANNIPGLPFGLDGMLGPSLGGQRALPGADGFVELPPATPVTRDGRTYELADEEPRYLPLDRGDADYSEGVYTNGATHGDEASSADPAPGVALQLSLTPERMEKTLRFLDEARFGGLVTHLFAIRAFFPDAVGSLGAPALQREALRETLDRLFIKLRLPNYTIAERDLETSASRASLEVFLAKALHAEGHAPPPPPGSRVLAGAIDPPSLRELFAGVHDAPLATALPWLSLAQFIPAGEPELRNYRDVLTAALGDLVALEAAGFIEALQRKSYPVLDAALDVVRTNLATVRT